MRNPILAVLLISCFTSAVLAATYVVNPDGSGDFPTIQAAIDAATGGDIIELTDGIFTGLGNRDLEFLGKAITVCSQSGNAADCIIDCELQGRGVYFRAFETEETVLEGVSIINGFVTGGYPDGGGGGIHCYRASPIVRDCIIAHCHADWAGGILSHQSYPPQFIRCTLYANESLNRAGGFDAYQGGPILDGCTIVGNTAASGGGMSANEGANVTVTNTIIAFNEGGGSVSCYNGSEITLSCSNIYGNDWWDWFGGVGPQYGINGNISKHPLFCDVTNADFHLQENSPCAAENHPECDLIGAWPVACAPIDYACCLGEECQILSEITCASLGGEWLPGELSCDPNPCVPALYVITPDGTGDFPTIQEAIDAAEESDIIELVDGVYVGTGNRDVDFRGKSLTLRSQSGDPEACVIDCEASVADQHRGLFIRHYEGPGTLVAGISIVNGYWGGGSGIQCEGSENPTTITDCIIGNCCAEDVAGGGLRCYHEPGPIVVRCTFRDNRAIQNGAGGAECLSTTNAQFTDCVFKGNNGPRGGGVKAEGASPSFVRCVFVDNYAFDGGGALYGQGDASLTITDCLFEENHTHGNGGALHFWSGTSSVSGCLFQGNIADNHAGAVYSQMSNTNLELRECEFVVNQAQRGGAVMTNHVGWTTIEDCTFDGNSAEHGGAISFSITTNHPAYVGGCLFNANIATAAGGAIHNSHTAAMISHCTLAENDAPLGSGVRTAGEYSDLQLENTLIAFGLQGEAVSVYEDTEAYLVCCDLHANEGGDWVGAIAGQYGINGNIAADPIFCGELHPPEPYMLRNDSPCAEDNNPECGQVGAYGVGCTQQGSGFAEDLNGSADAWNLRVYPTVASGAVSVQFNVPAANDGNAVRLRVFDPAGRLVEEILNAPVRAGQQEILWDGTAKADVGGIYFLTFEVPGRIESRRLIVLR